MRAMCGTKDESRLTFDERDAMMQLLLEFHDVFSLSNMELGVTDRVQHTIDTGEHPPVKQYAQWMPYALRKVAKLLEEMLAQGVIRPTKSPWASTIVLVTKRDGTLQFCIDYHRLNHVTTPDVYPMPRIEDYLDALAGQQYFSTLDLCLGYWQVAMSPESIEKTAFVMHEGAYKFTVMPFRLCNAHSSS